MLLNEDSLIDYMLLHIFIGADDWPEHNWWAGRKSRGTTPGDGFHFFPWDQEISNENTTYWPNINTAVLGRLTAAGLWSTIVAPAFSPFGGAVPITHTFTMTNPNGSGTLHYTLDGTDPRAFGGGIAVGAVTYSGAIAVNSQRTVKARVRTTGGEWSPMAEAAFTIIVDSDSDGLGDGHSNLLEYRAGTDPRAPGSILKFNTITRFANTVTLTLTARANRAYTLQRSTDLVTWTDAATHPAEPAEHTATFTDTVTGPTNFYRLAPSVP